LLFEVDKSISSLASSAYFIEGEHETAVILSLLLSSKAGNLRV